MLQLIGYLVNQKVINPQIVMLASQEEKLRIVLILSYLVTTLPESIIQTNIFACRPIERLRRNGWTIALKMK